MLQINSQKIQNLQAENQNVSIDISTCGRCGGGGGSDVGKDIKKLSTIAILVKPKKLNFAKIQKGVACNTVLAL